MASASSLDSAPAIDSAPLAIGIDLGTTYSCVGVFQHGTVEIIANDYGNRTTPSCVTFNDDERFVGEAAKLQMATNPTNTVFSAKRLIGRRFQDESVQSDLNHWPFEVVEQEDNPRIRVEHESESKIFYPQEISSMILVKMKQLAEDYLEQTVTKAVVTVPAYFSNSQRQATKEAAAIAGLDVLRIINEPTAAAIAYGLIRERGRTWTEKRSLLVFDLGGGTLDTSVVTIKEGVFEVIATAGDTHLGGDDFDNRMVDHFAKEFERKHQENLTTSKSALCHLRAACEFAKRALTWNTHAKINIHCLFKGVDFHSTITREMFEDLNADFFSKSMELVEKVLSDANMEKAAVDDIVMVGGSSRIPKIRKLMRNFFGKALCKDINPDEAVAYGAAVQAAILNGEQFHHFRGFRLQDVAPLSLGTDTIDSLMSVVIKRNTPIPTRRTKTYITTLDNQTCVSVKVFEGERTFIKDNNLLGQFVLGGIQIAPKGIPNIDITFSIDSDGILHVSAVDRSTGAHNELTITNDAGRLSEEEIRRMVRDAKKFKEVDEKQRSRISAMNALERCALSFKFNVERDKVKGNISEIYRKKVLDKVNDTLEWLDRNQRGERNVFEDMQRELTRICDPDQLGENDDFEDEQNEPEKNSSRRMVRDAEKFKEEDEQQRSHISSVNAMESCALSFRSTVESNKVKGKISESYRKKFIGKMNDTLKWCKGKKRGEKDKSEDKPKEREENCEPISAEISM